MQKAKRLNPNQAVRHRSGGKAARTGQLREPLDDKKDRKSENMPKSLAPLTLPENKEKPKR
jgi:hypothetical protein